MPVDIKSSLRQTIARFCSNSNFFMLMVMVAVLVSIGLLLTNTGQVSSSAYRNRHRNPLQINNQTVLPTEGPSMCGAITEFSALDDLIRYDPDVQAPSVLLIVQWALNNPPLDYSVSFAQVMIDGNLMDLPVHPASDAPNLEANQAYLNVCVWGAGCMYDSQVRLRMNLIQPDGAAVASCDLSIPVEIYSMVYGDPTVEAQPESTSTPAVQTSAPNPLHTDPQGSLPTCDGIECVTYDLSTQPECWEVEVPPTQDIRWAQGMSRLVDNEILGGDIIAYRLQWYNGNWSGWFVPGVNDTDIKYNVESHQMRLMWSYFYDHTHAYIVCS